MTSLHLGHAPGVLKLLGLEFIVVLPGFEKAFEEGAVRDADFRSDFEFHFVKTFRFSHLSSSLSSAFSILPIPARRRQLFRRLEETVLPGAASRARACRDRLRA